MLNYVYKAGYPVSGPFLLRISCMEQCFSYSHNWKLEKFCQLNWNLIMTVCTRLGMDRIVVFFLIRYLDGYPVYRIIVSVFGIE